MSSPDKTRAGISLREEGARKAGACKTDGRVATHADELHKTAGARKTGDRGIRDLRVPAARAGAPLPR